MTTLPLHHRALLAAALMLPLLATSAEAQHPLLHRGDAAIYSRRVEVRSTMVTEEKTYHVFNDDSVRIAFTIDSAGGNDVRWTKREIGELRLGTFTNEGEKRETKRVPLNMRPIGFATDTTGAPLDDEGRRHLGGIARVNGGLESKVIPALWFLPARLRGAAMGATLTQSYGDEIPGAQRWNGIDSPTEISYKLEIRRAGTFDTLGRRVVKMEWKIEDLHYTSSSRTVKNGEEEEIEYTSDGSSSGAAYFAADDGMLVMMRGKGDLLMTAVDDDDGKVETRSVVVFVIVREAGVR